MKGSTPISSKRAMAPAASFVCNVVNTKCPVNAASIAVFAVSKSRVSPTNKTSGSCRKNARKILAKVRFFSRIT